MRIWPVCLVIALLALLFLTDGRAAAEAGDELPVVVTGVGDGDTLTVRLADGGVETLRLIGIDAPEGEASLASTHQLASRGSGRSA